MAKVFTPVSITWLGCVLLAQPIARFTENTAQATQDTRQRNNSTRRNRRPSTSESRNARRKLRLHFTSAKALGASQGSVQHSYEKRQIPKILPGKGIRAGVQGFRHTTRPPRHHRSSLTPHPNKYIEHLTDIFNRLRNSVLIRYAGFQEPSLEGRKSHYPSRSAPCREKSRGTVFQGNVSVPVQYQRLLFGTAIPFSGDRSRFQGTRAGYCLTLTGSWAGVHGHNKTKQINTSD